MEAPELAQSAIGGDARSIRPVRRIADNVFAIGGTVLDRTQRTVTIPGRMCARTNVIKDALVSPDGRGGESLLTTEASPRDIHIACRLLGLSTTELQEDLGQYTDLCVCNVTMIDVTWSMSGTSMKQPLEKFLGLTDNGGTERGKTERGKTEPAHGFWFYHGSSMNQTGIAAQLQESIISLIPDPNALVSRLWLKRHNDVWHVADECGLPPPGAPLEIILRFSKITMARPTRRRPGEEASQ